MNKNSEMAPSPNQLFFSQNLFHYNITQPENLVFKKLTLVMPIEFCHSGTRRQQYPRSLKSMEPKQIRLTGDLIKLFGFYGTYREG